MVETEMTAIAPIFPFSYKLEYPPPSDIYWLILIFLILALISYFMI